MDAKEVAERATHMKSQFLGESSSSAYRASLMLRPSQYESRDPYALQRGRRARWTPPRFTSESCADRLGRGASLFSPLVDLSSSIVAPQTIKNSSDELLVVINDILDYSKIELDHLSLHLEKVQLRSALERSMDMVAERAASKSIELALILEQGDIDVRPPPPIRETCTHR